MKTNLVVASDDNDAKDDGMDKSRTTTQCAGSRRFLLDDKINRTEQDLENQRVIRVDAERTRAPGP